MTIEAFLAQLDRVRSRGSDRWSSRCPAHADRSPSLSIHEINNKILIHCFGGCEPQEIVKALGLTTADLFTERPTAPNHRPTPIRQKVNLDGVAFQFELGALDRRLRAERVLKAIGGFGGEGMEDDECDRLMKAVADAYEDQDRAGVLESVADDLRTKAYRERIAHHAA